jgi:GH15 family glucan-1,4-alpha-glucosidase
MSVTAATTKKPEPSPPASSIPDQPRIEDLALIGDLGTAALVAKDGSINFLCLPDFDSDACFTALLGTPDNGRWKIAPREPVRQVRRRYLPNTLILETELETDGGAVRLIDFMPIRKRTPHVIRIVEGVRGDVTLRFELVPRFSYGVAVPLESRRDSAFAAIAGPDALYLRGGAGKDPAPFSHELQVRPGQRVPYVLSWARPYDEIPESIDAESALRETDAFWTRWASQIRAPAGFEDVVVRSLITLKACTYRPSGAIVAAPTFGLPETPGGERNWDYRFCWIRDSVLTLNALLQAGLRDEATAFGRWLADAIGGSPAQLQIMYGIRGERRLTEVQLPWLQGYSGARPVRIGNAAYEQFQLDVLGEFANVVDVYVNALNKPELDPRLQAQFEVLASAVAKLWTRPDHGIWEMRGSKQSFTASKVAAWTVIDRWLRLIDRYKLEIDKAPWEALRKAMFDEICEKGYDPVRNTFTQYYGSKSLDASLLMIPLSGFLPADDPRVVGTVRAIEQDLLRDSLVLRYRTDASDDGLSGEEGVFLACSFWLAGTYAMMGRRDEARGLFDRVANLRNDVGLLAEEYLPREARLIGNFPQAFSHLALVTCAFHLAETAPPSAR